MPTSCPIIFDQNHIRAKRQRICPIIGKDRFLLDKIADNLADRLVDMTGHFDHIAITGAARLSPENKQAFIKNAKSTRAITIDTCLADIITSDDTLPLTAQSQDAIISYLSLHLIDDLPGALIQIRRALRPDGLFLGAMFGGESLHELRQSLTAAEIECKGGAAARVMPFADKPQMGDLIHRAGFALPVIDSDIIQVSYPNIYALMHDLRAMGETNATLNRPRDYPGKAFFACAQDIYQSAFPCPHKPGRITASFEIIYLIGWAPHPRQQQPAPRGSADIDFADIF